MVRRRLLPILALLLPATALDAADPSVVTRPRLTAAGAHALIDAVLERAARDHITLSIAVVDAGGNLMSFQRMEGSPIGMIAVAEAKARSAAIYKVQTRDIGELVKRVGLPMLTSPDMIALGGGVPILVDGVVVGALGVTGGTGQQDIDTATAAIAAVVR